LNATFSDFKVREKRDREKRKGGQKGGTRGERGGTLLVCVEREGRKEKNVVCELSRI
jgi:hypothetical protein